MSGLSRKMRRAARRKNGHSWPSSEQRTIVRDDHYMTLHPTRGWKRISNKRVEAQHRMAQMLGA